MNKIEMVGNCRVCDMEMYDYELHYCGCCGSRIHHECQQLCARCDFKGCLYCFIEDPRNGEWYCGLVCMEDDRIAEEADRKRG